MLILLAWWWMEWMAARCLGTMKAICRWMTDPEIQGQMVEAWLRVEAEMDCR